MYFSWKHVRKYLILFVFIIKMMLKDDDNWQALYYVDSIHENMLIKYFSLYILFNSLYHYGIYKGSIPSTFHTLVCYCNSLSALAVPSTMQLFLKQR